MLTLWRKFVSLFEGTPTQENPRPSKEAIGHINKRKKAQRLYYYKNREKLLAYQNAYYAKKKKGK